MAQPMRLNAQTSDLQRTNLPVLILAGGLGTRLQSVVYNQPKVLASVGGQPFVTYLLRWLACSGCQEVILCVGYLGEQVEATLGATYGPLSLRYSYEDQPLGTGGALRLALDKFQRDSCLILNGDSYVDADLNAFLHWHNEHGFEGSILLTEIDDVARYGSVEVTEQGKIQAFREKQLQSEKGHINAGIYILSRKLLESIPPQRTVSIERDCFPEWLHAGLGGFPTAGKFIDIGTPESFARAEAFFKNFNCR